MRQAVKRATAPGGAFESEFRVVLPGGSIRRFRSHGRMQFEAGEPRRLNVASIDITQAHEMVMKLEEATRAKSEYLAAMSHEIRTPINGLLGTVDLLLDLGVSAEQKTYVDTIRSCGGALLTIINDILDLSKIEAGMLVVESIPFHLERLLDETVAVVAPLAGARGLELRMEFEQGLPDTLTGDPQHLRQVLLNLLSNAVKFTSHGCVTLRVSSLDRTADSLQLEFTVVDTGIGIPPEAQKAIFEPFVQADSSTTRRYGGTGLGLPISRKLIEAMQGHLEIQSEPGRGSTFRFSLRLPIAAGSNVPAVALRDRIPHSVRPLRVLLAEDNPVNQKVAARMMERMGHHVDFAANGIQAVSAVRKSQYDVILMDCQMPEMDGYAATRAIRLLECGVRLPIIAMTANAMPEDRKCCLDAGMNDYISKPVSATGLYYLLEAVTDNPGNSKPEDHAESGTVPEPIPG
jgi:signal transduction histidine kinase/ActR/RegA family two-component response regulator